jgi:hypothetical protein
VTCSPQRPKDGCLPTDGRQRRRAHSIRGWAGASATDAAQVWTGTSPEFQSPAPAVSASEAAYERGW